jgi:hypothetical protein
LAQFDGGAEACDTRSDDGVIGMMSLAGSSHDEQ